MSDRPGLHEAAAAFAAEDDQMIETHKINLAPLELTVGDVALLVAEMPVERSPFVLVHYTVAGEPQSWGHRLDLDKRTFLDRFEDGSPSEVREAADKLTDFLLPRRRALN